MNVSACVGERPCGLPRCVDADVKGVHRTGRVEGNDGAISFAQQAVHQIVRVSVISCNLARVIHRRRIRTRRIRCVENNHGSIWLEQEAVHISVVHIKTDTLPEIGRA